MGCKYLFENDCDLPDFAVAAQVPPAVLAITEQSEPLRPQALHKVTVDLPERELAQECTGAFEDSIQLNPRHIGSSNSPDQCGLSTHKPPLLENVCMGRKSGPKKHPRNIPVEASPSRFLVHLDTLLNPDTFVWRSHRTEGIQSGDKEPVGYSVAAAATTADPAVPARANRDELHLSQGL